MKKYFIVTLILSFIIIFCSCSNNNKKLYSIAFIEFNEAKGLQESASGVISALKKAGFEDSRNISIKRFNAQGEHSNIYQIINSVNNGNYDMVITVSTPCMIAAAKGIKKIPVVFTVASSPEDVKLGKIPDNLSGVYDPMDYSGLVNLLLKLKPEVKSVGIPFTASEVNANIASKRIEELLKLKSITTISMVVNSSADVFEIAKSMAVKGIDAFIVAADNTVLMALDAVAKVANKERIPLLVSDPNYVISGASIGYGINYYSWGEQSGEIAAEIIKGKSTKDIGLRKCSNTTLYINKKAAALQNLKISTEIYQKAQKTFE